jgi:5-methylcytosine-specific restriction endonuclease McrA
MRLVKPFVIIMGFDYEKYKKYLKSDEWWDIIKFLRKLKGNECHNCGTTNNIQAHHLTYAHLYQELDYPEDLIILCESCHEFEHAELNDIKRVNTLRDIKQKQTFILMNY